MYSKLVRQLNKTQLFVEAKDEEKHQLHVSVGRGQGEKWQDLTIFVQMIGYDQTWVMFTFSKINGKLVCFYHPTLSSSNVNWTEISNVLYPFTRTDRCIGGVVYRPFSSFAERLAEI